MAKEVEKKKEAGALANPMADMMGDATLGFEGMTAKDVAIPFVSILQTLSPQIKKGPQKIDDAEEGDIFNSVTQEVIKGSTGIRVIPCAYQKRWVEWKTRESGGGFIQQHDSEGILSHTKKNDRGQDMLPNGHIIVTTAYHYVIILKEDGSYERVVISMTSTQLKKSRRWNAQMGSIQLTGQGGKKFVPPTFSHSYLMYTTTESKNNNTWCSWVIEDPQLIAMEMPDIYQIAKRFNQDVAGGTVKVQEPVDNVAEGAPAESEHF